MNGIEETTYKTEKGAVYKVSSKGVFRNGESFGEMAVYLEPRRARGLYQDAGRSKDLTKLEKALANGDNYNNSGGILVVQKGSRSFYWSSPVIGRTPGFDSIDDSLSPNITEDESMDFEMDN